MINEQGYLILLEKILKEGYKKSVFGHTDKFIYSLFGEQLRFDCSSNKIPLLTTRKTYYRGAFEEMLWFVEGSNDVVKLHKKKVKFWNEWGCKHFNKVSSLNLTVAEFEDNIDFGLITECVIPTHYSNMCNWKFENKEVNQIDWVVKQIQKNPDRKSYFVSSWNPTQVYHMADECQIDSVVLPACHVCHQVVVNDGKLNLHLIMRSWDYFLGAAANIAQYGLLLHLYSFLTGFPAQDLVISVSDVHLYSDHLEQAKELLKRTPYEFPTLKICDSGQKNIKDFKYKDFEIVGYKNHGSLTAPITCVGGY